MLHIYIYIHIHIYIYIYIDRYIDIDQGTWSPETEPDFKKTRT